MATNIQSDTLTQVRCIGCGILLLCGRLIHGYGHIEIKCRGCRRLNVIDSIGDEPEAP